MPERDWVEWHRVYENPASYPSRRLVVLRRSLGVALDNLPPGPLVAVSLCAGQGHDIIPVLAEHPRGVDVTAILVELDPRNAERALAAARASGLRNVRVRVADAGVTDSYADLPSASLVLVSGFLRYLGRTDRSRLIRRLLPALCARGALVVWAVRPRGGELATFRRHFRDAGFESVPFAHVDDPEIQVGIERFVGEPATLQPSSHVFALGRPRLPLRTRLRRRLARVKRLCAYPRWFRPANDGNS